MKMPIFLFSTENRNIVTKIKSCHRLERNMERGMEGRGGGVKNPGIDSYENAINGIAMIAMRIEG